MYIFIDESGIHKTIDHSSFALVYITVENYPAVEDQVQKIEQQLGRGAFHWKDTVWNVKKEFMDEALKLDFQAKIAIVRNPVVMPQALERALAHMVIERNIKQIVIDGKKPKAYARVMKKILRDKGVKTGKLRMVNDRQFAGVRLADMVAGLARSYYDQKNLVRITPYFERLKKKTIVIIEQW